MQFIFHSRRGGAFLSFGFHKLEEITHCHGLCCTGSLLFFFSISLTCRSPLLGTVPPPPAAAPILLRRRRHSSSSDGGAPSLRCPSSLLRSSHRRSSFPRAGPPWVEVGRARELPGLGPRATRDQGEGRRSKGMARASRSGGWGRERGRVRRGHQGQWRCLPRCGVLLR